MSYNTYVIKKHSAFGEGAESGAARDGRTPRGRRREPRGQKNTRRRRDVSRRRRGRKRAESAHGERRCLVMPRLRKRNVFRRNRFFVTRLRRKLCAFHRRALRRARRMKRARLSGVRFVLGGCRERLRALLVRRPRLEDAPGDERDVFLARWRSRVDLALARRGAGEGELVRRALRAVPQRGVFRDGHLDDDVSDGVEQHSGER
mmetsp:Transcript_1301/g.5445  ORF Transcript_1301/g.5445 Transcript_1301/m.5445 type:complete len:204 (+) Transcript_1301:1-612(+)